MILLQLEQDLYHVRIISYDSHSHCTPPRSAPPRLRGYGVHTSFRLPLPRKGTKTLKMKKKDKTLTKLKNATYECRLNKIQNLTPSVPDTPLLNKDTVYTQVGVTLRSGFYPP
jgi:hypothetical protein